MDTEDKTMDKRLRTKGLRLETKNQKRANAYRYTKPYSNSVNIIFKEEDVFVTEVPLEGLFKNATANATVNARQRQIKNFDVFKSIKDPMKWQEKQRIEWEK